MVLCDVRWSDAKDCSYGDRKNYTDVLEKVKLHDKSALYLPRQCLRNGGKSLDFIGFLGWKRRIYTLFTPLEDRSGIVEIIIDKGVGEKSYAFCI